MEELRELGIRTGGSVRWGTHFCQFYKTKKDTLGSLVSYFKAGCDNNEFGMWITDDAETAKEGGKALQEFIKRGQMEIWPYDQWYLEEDRFSADRVLKAWVDKLKAVKKRRYSGLRLAEDTGWPGKNYQKSFKQYEKKFHILIRQYPIIAAGLYCTDKYRSPELIEIMQNHQFSLINKGKKWRRWESAEKDKTETELRESRERYRELVEGSNSIIMQTDENLNITYMNDFGLKFFGYTARELLGKNVIGTTVPPMEDTGRNLLNMTEDIKENPQNYQTNIHKNMRKNGEQVWILWTNKARYDEKGKLKEILAIGNDISKQKKYEADLALAQKSANAGIWDWDMETGKLSWTPQLFTLFGLNEEGKADFDVWKKILHKDDKQEALDKLNTAIKERTPLVNEYRIVLKDGGIRWISALGNTVYNLQGKPIRMSGICLDITERKQLENQLLEKSKEWEMIFDSVPALVFYKDKENRFVRVNKAFERVMKIPREKLEGKSLFEIYPKKLAQKYWDDDAVVIKSGQPKRNIVEEMETAEGLRYLQTDKIAYKDEQGRTAGVIGFSVDITERKELEQRKDMFISIASHELKTPITSIKIYAQLLQRLETENKNAPIYRYTGKIVEQIDKMTLLINDMLDVSRIQSGKLTLRKQRFSLRKLVKDTAELYQKIADKHKIIIKTGQKGRVLADRDRIGQVLLNLLSNAVRYSPEGSSIWVETEATNKELVVSVKDEGRGIDKKDQEKIFDSFYRIYDKQNVNISGLGMGLYIAAEVVKRHKGKIWVKSRKGQGATFYISLPRG